MNKQISSSNDRIHVVHVVTSLEPGGLENGVVNLANRLDPDRFCISVVCLERLGEFCKRLNSEIVVHCLEKPPGFSWNSGMGLGALLGELKADIIHTHNLGPLLYGVIARRFGKGCGKIVQGEHAQLRDDEKIWKRKWLRRLGYASCASIHTVSAGLRDEIVEFGLSGEKIHIILNGVDCERFSPATPEQTVTLRNDQNIPSSAFVIGMVGRFGAFKQHIRMIDAFESLADRYPDLYLLLVGDHGPQKDEVLSRCAGSKYGDRIIRAGFQLDPLPWYRMMDLLAIPSENEGLSNAMLEAMACGIPCLTHPACGATEVIQDESNGLLRPLANELQLAKELSKVIQDRKTLADLSTAARQTALDQFSLDAMIDGYAKLYDDASRSNN